MCQKISWKRKTIEFEIKQQNGMVSVESNFKNQIKHMRVLSRCWYFECVFQYIWQRYWYTCFTVSYVSLWWIFQFWRAMLCGAKPNKSPGPDNISARLLTSSSYYYSSSPYKPIQYVDVCLQYGKRPTSSLSLRMQEPQNPRTSVYCLNI